MSGRLLYLDLEQNNQSCAGMNLIRLNQRFAVCFAKFNLALC